MSLQLQQVLIRHLTHLQEKLTFKTTNNIDPILTLADLLLVASNARMSNTATKRSSNS